jgi:hypothetical protein
MLKQASKMISAMISLISSNAVKKINFKTAKEYFLKFYDNKATTQLKHFIA